MRITLWSNQSLISRHICSDRNLFKLWKKKHRSNVRMQITKCFLNSFTLRNTTEFWVSLFTETLICNHSPSTSMSQLCLSNRIEILLLRNFDFCPRALESDLEVPGCLTDGEHRYVLENIWQKKWNNWQQMHSCWLLLC